MKSIDDEYGNNNGWIETNIGSFTPFLYGKSLPEDSRNLRGLVPVYGSNGVIGYHDTPLVSSPTVVIGRKGTVGAVHFCKSGCWPIDTTFYFTGTDIESVRYAYYVLNSLGLNKMNSDSAVPGLNRGNAHAIKIRIPISTTEQRRIAHILGTLDDKIENNRKTAKTLEAMAQAIFKSWFVDFDPVRAKMAGESRESICKRLKLTPEILDLFPDRLVDSELGEIPEGWGVGTFGDYADIVGGSTPSTNNPDYWLSGLHSWATPKDLSNLTIPVLLVTENKITDAGLQQISSRLLPVGTVLLSSRAPIGYLAIAEIPVAINQGFIALKPHNREDNIFLMLLIKHNMDEIISRANGSTFLEVSKAKFRPIPVISPAQAILRFFAKLVIPLFLRIASLEKFTRILTIQRDTLLPKLISGEIRVPEAKYCVEAAMSGEV